ncbi:hypothetical protein PSPO01_00167 [Paraphaeosphaeria sporulosa]
MLQPSHSQNTIIKQLVTEFGEWQGRAATRAVVPLGRGGWTLGDRRQPKATGFRSSPQAGRSVDAASEHAVATIVKPPTASASVPEAGSPKLQGASMQLRFLGLQARIALDTKHVGAELHYLGLRPDGTSNLGSIAGTIDPIWYPQTLMTPKNLTDVRHVNMLSLDERRPARDTERACYVLHA